MLKGNVVELMLRNTAITYCALCIATYRVARQSHRPVQCQRFFLDAVQGLGLHSGLTFRSKERTAL